MDSTPGKFVNTPLQYLHLYIYFWSLNSNRVASAKFFYPNGGVPGNSVEHSSRCSQVQAEQQESIGGMYLETGHWKFDLDSSSASFI